MINENPKSLDTMTHRILIVNILFYRMLVDRQTDRQIGEDEHIRILR